MADIPKSVIDTLIAEAIGEGPEGMRRVAETILNRAAVRGLTPEQVVTQPYQYTGYSAPGPSAREAQRNAQSRAAAEAAFRLAMEPGDPTGGADHYYAPGTISQPYWASSMRPTGEYGGHAFFASRPIPPGDIPNVVASRLSVTPPRAVPPVTPTTMPPMLAAQRNLTPVSTDTSSLYRGIYPDRQLTQGGEIDRSVRDAQSSQDSALAAALQARISAPTRPAAPPMPSRSTQSYAGQERAPARPAPPAMSRAPITYAAQDRAPPRAPAPPAARLPTIQAPANLVATSMQRAADAQDQRLQAALTNRPGPMNGTGSLPSFEGFLAELGPARPAIPGPPSPPKSQERLAAGRYPAAPALAATPPVVAPIQVGVATQAQTAFPPLPRPRPLVPPKPVPVAPAPLPVAMPPQAPTRPPLRVTVNGAGSYSAPPPIPAFAGVSSGQMYTPGAVYQMGGQRFAANPNQSFTNLLTGRVLPGSSGNQNNRSNRNINGRSSNTGGVGGIDPRGTIW